MPPEVLGVVGPTATGKSALAIELAERLGGEIVNADALQVYRGLDIGTAKPTAEQQARVPHHLIDVLEPTEPYSAGDFARRARTAIGAILARSRLPIVVGGSGLYLRALFSGLSALPEVDPAVRGRLRRELEEGGLAPLRRELERSDPVTAARLEPADTQRTVRALEVVRATGRPLSSWVEDSEVAAPRFSFRRLGLTLPRGLLYDRIEARVVGMLNAGWVAEIEALLASGVPPDAAAFQAIGYGQLIGYLQGRSTLEEARTETVTATRRYAKRQLTWFRREEGVRWLDARSSVAELLDQVADG